MEFKSAFRCLLLLGVAIGIVQGICHPKDFGHGATVCLCSESQKCTEGDFAHLKLNNKSGVINNIRTTKTGDRFTQREFHFLKEEPKNQAQVRLELVPSRKYQKILGFGGAFTDASGINIGKLPKDLQERLIRDYFADDGLEYRMGRVPIGGSDFSPRAYSLDDHENDDTLEKFALQPEDLQYKIPYIKMAQELTGNKVKLFGSAWSAPIWMKTNHEFNHGGFLKGEPGGKYYKLFAKYLVRFLEEYQKAHAPMWGITVVNEPEFGFNPNWGINVLGFNSTMQRDFIKLDLGPALKEANFGSDKIKLMINDDNVNTMSDMTNTILEDPEAAKYVSGVAFHWYGNGGYGQIGPLDELSPKYPNVFFLSTEACELKHLELGNWTVAEKYVLDIINDLNHNTSGWVEWNMALDPDGGPIWAGGKLDASLVVNGETKEYYKNPSFYALGHFSKFLQPDSVRLHYDWKATDSQVFVTVFERPDGSRVANTLNRNAKEVSLQIHDPGHGFAELSLPANSIESFVWY